MTLPEQLFVDALFSAIAAVGFAVISNPPFKAVVVSAMLSAIAHSFRYYLMNELGMDIATSTFMAAISIGLMSIGFAKLMQCPSEVFTFPSMLPMIPGMYAYKMFLSMAKFIRTDDVDFHPALIQSAVSNGLTATFIMLSLVIGVSLPMMLFHKNRLTMTRNRD